MDGPKYGLNQVVSYNGIVYRVKTCHALNWSMSNPYVYGLILAHSTTTHLDSSKLLYVCEQQLSIATEHQSKIWELLYGSIRLR